MRSGPEEIYEPGFLSLTPERARVLLLVAVRPAAQAMLVIAVLVLLTLLTSGDGMAGTSAAIAASWLAMHQVPLVVGQTTLGLLPLLPTAVLLWAAARECARAMLPDSSRADLGWLIGAALGGPLLVTAVCLAVVEDASGILPVRSPNALGAFGWVLALHTIAAVAGMVSQEIPHVVDVLRLPDWAVTGLRCSGRTALRLLACAAAVTVVSLLAHWSALGEGYGSAGNVWGVLGLTALSLVYLPNVVVGALGVLMGAPVQFGAASISLFEVVGGPVPAVPVLAALPVGPAAGWWPLLMALPAAVGVVTGLDLARTGDDEIRRPWSVLVCAAGTTLVLLVAALLAGGELGGFGHVGLDLLVFAASSFLVLAFTGWIGLIAARLVLDRRAGRVGHGYYDDDDYDRRGGSRADHEDGRDDDHYDDDHYDEHYDDDYDDDDYDDEHDYYYDDDYDDEHYDDHHDGDYEDGDPDHGHDEDDYDPDHGPERDDPDHDVADRDHEHDEADRDHPDAIEAEVLDDPPAVSRPRREPAADIVDAEVVDPDAAR
ncbi:cell division protein PerM [Nocardia shimofusensis]|uniref:cell division protein PerM n=1 Tax=Nocardia shimofusensis TaxID=228596 RepID=UPI000A6A0BAA|nr:DUF6350 family protein [Nocardia shimofusensis]